MLINSVLAFVAVIKGAGALVVIGIMLWVFWMSWEWLRSPKKNSGEIHNSSKPSPKTPKSKTLPPPSGSRR